MIFVMTMLSVYINPVVEMVIWNELIVIIVISISGKSQVYVDREWKDVASEDSFLLPKLEGQVWQIIKEHSSYSSSRDMASNAVDVSCCTIFPFTSASWYLSKLFFHF